MSSETPLTRLILLAMTATCIFTAAPQGALAAPRFNDGVLYTSLQNINCSSIINGTPRLETEVGAFVGQYIDDADGSRSPVPGEVFDVRIVIATIGNNCAGTAPQVEIALPPGVRTAVDARNPIRCYSSVDYGNEAAWQAIPASAGCPSAPGAGLTSHAAVASWIGLNPDPATYGSALWKIGQGTGIQIRVPVVADRTMNGIGDTNGCVCVVASIKTGNAHALPDPAFTWSSAAPQGTPYQHLFVFPGSPPSGGTPGGTPPPAGGTPGGTPPPAGGTPPPAGGTPPVSGVALANRARPQITGRTVVGRSARCTPGRWTGKPRSFSYRWQRRVGNTWRIVPRATRQTLTLTPPLGGSLVRCQVTARTATARAVAYSPPKRVVAGRFG